MASHQDLLEHPDCRIVERTIQGTALALFDGALAAKAVSPKERPLLALAAAIYEGIPVEQRERADRTVRDTVLGSLRALLVRADALGPIPVAFIAIKPSPARGGLRSAIRQVNDAARQLLAARPLGHFIDAHAPMLGRDGQPVAALFAEDGLHLSAAGYRPWTEILHSYRHPLLAP